MRSLAKPCAFARPLWVRLAQIFSLFVWLVGATPILPGMAAVAADLDGQHEVLLMRTESGMSVVLHHGTGDQAPDHRHSAVSDFLSMVGSEGAMGPDHVLMFSEGEASREGAVSGEVRGREADEENRAWMGPAVRWVSEILFLMDERADGARRRSASFRVGAGSGVRSFAAARMVCLRI